ncbi:hypothetical protein GOP47_0012383 [Adiantum capillus-veneris]|uniref:starch synthase n=1 Tax=Adiantum capillus-veneris TaxID=13818 RepID=A0A9D4ZFM5_ADICA|nr:hypothetical protein GOP47_0012383 [Adiantum capillus-veneris]
MGKAQQHQGGDESGSGSGSMEEISRSTTVEQGKRILALQKDLLDQIAERKKLVTALKKNLGQAAEQVKAYNSSETSSTDSAVLKEESVPGIIGLRSSPMHSDVSSVEKQEVSGSQLDAPITGNKANESGTKPPSAMPPILTEKRGGLVSQFGSSVKGSKAFEPETNTPSFPSLADVFKLSKSSGVSSSAQGASSLVQEKKASHLKGEEEPTVKVGPSDEPVIAGSANSVTEPTPPLAGPNVMNVIIVAAECAPWSKTGGLGDVAGALPKALARRGHRVMVVAPRYGSYPDAWETGVRKRYNVAGQDNEVSYFHGYIDGVDHVFVDTPSFHGVSNNIYGGNREDVLKRMVLFCKAAVEVPWHVPCGGVCYGDGNLIFVANDWHTALLPVYLQAYYRDNGLMEFARSILVIHNIAHQGRGPLSDFSLMGLPEHYIEKFRLYDPVGGEHLNIFMAGLITAHRIVAVSHGYAWECQTQLGGWGLDGVVREHNWKLRGIVNGIDDKEWSPELDVHLNTDGYSNYSLNNLEYGKALCKAAFQKELGLPVRSDVPLLGFIGRLDNQKGVDIIADAMPWMMEQDLQLVMLGTGRADLENMLRSFESQHRDKVRAWVGFSVKTAHRITAGCDILLMPSRFEPCGLNQLYAMRYGTIPVVHAVGGLRDTVKAFDPYSNTGTGWTFDKADGTGLIHALGTAMWTFRDFKDSWKGIQERGMTQDLSWDQAAKQYEEVMVAAKYQW